MSNRNEAAAGGCLFILFWLSLVGLVFGTWLTHVIHCLANNEWGFLIAGAIVVPIANVHGFGLWFGWW